MRSKLFFIPISLILLIMIFLPTLSWSAFQNLDEKINRVSRLSSATWGYQYLENPANNYIWQPESFCYIDEVTGHEINVLVHGPGVQDIISKEHGTNAWSYDGSRIGFFTSDRSTGNSVLVGDYRFRWVVNSDGSGLRGVDGYGRRNFDFEGFGWAHTENAYYCFGSGSGEGSTASCLYKNTLDSNNVFTGTMLLNTSNFDSTRKEPLKDGVSGNDSWLVVRGGYYGVYGTPNNISTSKLYFIRLNPSPSVENQWGIARGCGPAGDPYGNHQLSLETRFHDAWSPGPNPQGAIGQFSGTGVFWWFKRNGSYSDGGPLWEDWNGSSFGVNEEIKCISNGAGSPNNPYNTPYFGHPVFDRWGRYGLVGTYTDSPAPGTRIWDSNSNSLLSNYVLAYGEYDGQHHSWTGWTDYVTAVDPSGGDQFQIKINKFNASYTNATSICESGYSGSNSNYNAYPRPSQSPDGTKVVFAQYVFNGSQASPYIAYATAYYPHPPEITTAQSSAGTVTVRFDWRLDQANPRGYTSRGWPDESNDDPPPPRETEAFRLWRSTDKSTWTPIGTTNANTSTKYDFSNGVWNGNSYWEITDSPGDGSFYYAVTSIEWSGLESHVLSNIYRITISGGAGAGTQDTAYPANPGGSTNFYTTSPAAPIDVSFSHKKSPATANGQYTIDWKCPANNSMIRYYNIYAEDGSTPAIQRQNRIASIPAASGVSGIFSWIDCFGNTDGSTNYAVTSVDFQGNESGVSSSNPAVDNDSDGYTGNDGDCNDNDPLVYPGAIEVCNGTDDNCDGNIDEGFDSDSDGYTTCQNDCDDNDPSMNPGMTEVLDNGKDDDCDPSTSDSAPSTETITMINVGDTWKYFKGTSNPGSGWNGSSFDDSSWMDGPTGIGFGDSDDATVLTDMQGNYLTVYARKTFSITDASAVTQLNLNMDYDDGFVAYINGVEVARSNVSGTPNYDTPASDFNEAGTPQAFDLSSFIGILQSGTNVLSVEAHNGEINSSDVSMIPELIITRQISAGGSAPGIPTITDYTISYP